MHPTQPYNEIQGDLALYRTSGQIDSHFSFFALPEKAKNWLPLVSNRDPQREVERILSGFQLQSGKLVIVRGISAGPTLHRLLKMQKNQGGWIVVLEADSLLAKAISEQVPGLTVFHPESLENLQHYLETFPVEEMSGYRFIGNAAIRLKPEFYSETELLFKKMLSSRISDLFTRMEFEPVWIFNALSSLKHLQRARPVSGLFNQFHGPAILVSTGPSLRHSLPWLKQNQDKIFLACADSAYRVLHRSGISPDLIVSLDSQPYTARHFGNLPKGKPGNGPVLYADLVANPQVVNEWQGDLLLGQTAHWLGDERHITPGCDFLEGQFFREYTGKIPGDVQSGGSVATSAFDLLRQLGFESIILVGQDLAYTNREIHCSGTHHTDIWLSKPVNRFKPLETINEQVIRKRHVEMTPGLRGKNVPADYVLGLYAKWFAEAAATVPTEILNGSYDGLVVHGLKPLNLQQYTPPQDAPKMRMLWNSTTLAEFPVSKESIDNFYSDLGKLEPAQVEVHPLFLRIGRKFHVSAVRAKTEEERNRKLERQREEKHRFMRRLRRKLLGRK
ncbi:MAG: motility associated factor glycosyltransferase family protein [Leptospiraceae bacterium]|nr:motility associated factor glycosyltransferase family protein [Leptospiraceae bacterium]